MLIKVKKTATVRPAQVTPNRVQWCSNLDVVVPRIHVPTVYFYRPNGSPEPGFFDPEAVKEALGRVLVPFYPMAGRVCVDRTGRVEIRCSGEGVTFIEAETTSSLDDLGDLALSSEVNDLIPFVDPAAGVSSYPLVLVQLTYFKCGGVSLGLCLHHLVADGYSAIHFVNTWADMARGHGLATAPPPFIDRTLLRARDPPRPTFDHIEYQPPPSPPPTYTTSSALKFSIFPIAATQLTALKAKSATAAARYTTYEMLSAHVWRSASRARQLLSDQLTRLTVPIDGRGRLRPPLPPGFLGNVTFSATPVARVGDLVGKPTSYASSRIHEAVVRMDDEYLRSAVDYLEANMGKMAEGREPMKQTFGCPNLGITSWMRLPFGGADFGWGGPVYARPGVNGEIEGLTQILASTENDGSMLVCITLYEEHMKLFEKYIYEI